MSEHSQEVFWSLEAEMSCLGSCFLSYDALRSAIERLRPEHFYRPAHRLIYTAMLTLVADGHSVDLVTMRNMLVEHGTLMACGGEDYLIQIQEYVPSPANASSYVEIIVRKWVLREIRIVADGIEPDSEIDIVRTRLDRALAGAVNPLRAAVSRLSPNPQTPKRRGVPTGIASLDAASSHKGSTAGQVVVVSAYQKSGKSSLMIQIGAAHAAAGGSVLYATFADLRKKDIEERILKQRTTWDHTPPVGSFDEERWHETIKLMNQWDFEVYDAAALRTGKDIETFLEYAATKHAKRPLTSCFVDYAQRLGTRARDVFSDESRMARISGEISMMAATLDIPMFLGSQITEGKDGAKDITKYGRVLEEDGGQILRIKREQGSENAYIEIPYQRFGDSAIKWKMRFNKSRLRFEDIEEQNG